MTLDEILRFKEWVINNNCEAVAIESTGVYWIPIYTVLEGSVEVILANAYKVKHTPRIEVPSETLVVEIGKDGLNIVETFMQMSVKDDTAQVICDICSKPLGKMKDVKHIESPETITIAVRNGFKPEQMLKDTENMLKEMGKKNPDDLMEIVFDSWKSIVDKSETLWALCDECYESIKNIKSLKK